MLYHCAWEAHDIKKGMLLSDGYMVVSGCSEYVGTKYDGYMLLNKHGSCGQPKTAAGMATLLNTEKHLPRDLEILMNHSKQDKVKRDKQLREEQTNEKK